MHAGSAEDALGGLIESVDPNEPQRAEAAERVITQLEAVAKGLGFKTGRNNEGSLGIDCGEAGTVWVAFGPKPKFAIWNGNKRVEPELQYRRYINEPKAEWVGRSALTDPETGLTYWEPGVDFLARAVVSFVTSAF